MNGYHPNDSYDSYRSVDLEARAASASPYELVLVLMDGLLDELARARGHIEHKRYQQKGLSLEKRVAGGVAERRLDGGRRSRCGDPPVPGDAGRAA